MSNQKETGYWRHLDLHTLKITSALRLCRVLCYLFFTRVPHESQMHQLTNVSLLFSTSIIVRKTIIRIITKTWLSFLGPLLYVILRFFLSYVNWWVEASLEYEVLICNPKIPKSTNHSWNTLTTWISIALGMHRCFCNLIYALPL